MPSHLDRQMVEEQQEVLHQRQRHVGNAGNSGLLREANALLLAKNSITHKVSIYSLVVRLTSCLYIYLV